MVISQIFVFTIVINFGLFYFVIDRIIDFAFSEVPSFFKLRENKPKYLLKKLASKILPKEFEIERKKGFIFPTNKFINHKSNFKY